MTYSLGRNEGAGGLRVSGVRTTLIGVGDGIAFSVDTLTAEPEHQTGQSSYP
jgi:hypothetical protein